MLEGETGGSPVQGHPGLLMKTLLQLSLKKENTEKRYKGPEDGSAANGTCGINLTTRV